jgi:hypothetical protein
VRSLDFSNWGSLLEVRYFAIEYVACESTCYALEGIYLDSILVAATNVEVGSGKQDVIEKLSLTITHH